MNSRIADIHGNLTALEAMTADLRSAGVDNVVCLGDVASTGPQPHDTVALLSTLACSVVMGNTDAAAFRPMQLWPADDEACRNMDIDRRILPEARLHIVARGNTYSAIYTMIGSA